MRIETAMPKTGRIVDLYPRAKPLIKLGAGPCLHALAKTCTGE
jgi:hypothetical protein